MFSKTVAQSHDQEVGADDGRGDDAPYPGTMMNAGHQGGGRRLLQAPLQFVDVEVEQVIALLGIEAGPILIGGIADGIGEADAGGRPDPKQGEAQRCKAQLPGGARLGVVLQAVVLAHLSLDPRPRIRHLQEIEELLQPLGGRQRVEIAEGSEVGIVHHLLTAEHLGKDHVDAGVRPLREIEGQLGGRGVGSSTAGRCEEEQQK